MTDLVSDTSNAQSPKRKFSFRFPQLAQSLDKDSSSSAAQNQLPKGGHGSNRARNFTEEIKNLPDLQVIFAVVCYDFGICGSRTVIYRLQILFG